MLIALCSLIASAAQPSPVVAVGDGIVVPADEPGDTSSGGWVAVLGDCLEERAPSRFTVVDRAQAGETLASVRDKLGAVRELSPAWVVVTLGARELAKVDSDPKAAGGQLGEVVGELRRGRSTSVIVVGPVPPNLADPQRQTEVDGRVRGFNEAAAALVGSSKGVFHLDPLAEWTRADQPRSGLVDASGGLSDQGQAKVAAAVCDIVLGR